ncbi:MAG: hypothetical protein M1831_006653 [Alyxoria varia]|nr:MAG: hypothetical protein M1831_006653 [Alyxoria varia]
MFRKRSHVTEKPSLTRSTFPNTHKSEHRKEDERHPQPGDKVYLSGFERLQLSNGQTVSLEDLMSITIGGMILFTYPQANSPGCIKQACQVREKYPELTAHGFSIYGVSRDPPETNQAFKVRLSLPYSLICDAQGSLIMALGLDAPVGGTIRGFVAIDKSGRVLASAVGPATFAGLEAIDPVLKALEGLNCTPGKAFGTTTAELSHNHLDSREP